MRDPIVAIATPPGRGGVGIVRLSGAAADLAPVRDALLAPQVRARLRPREALWAEFRDARGERIDDGLVLWFPAPRSYTGESVLELQGHGGPVVLRLLVARCLEAGRAHRLRLARPGEFTERAFLEGRLDLAQAEAVADLIDAGSGAAARAAARALAGEFSARVRAVADPLLELRALVEATLDFPDEEIDFLQAADARGRLQRVRSALDEVLLRSRQGAVLRDGLTVVLVGAPNVGKSSLMNRLAGEEVAIVTPIAGTTRDRIRQAIEIDGVPLHVVDTAGIRPGRGIGPPQPPIDEVERIGIARTLEEVARADAVLHVIDAGRATGDAAAAAAAAEADDADVLAQVRARLAPGVPVLAVHNKIDLLPAGASGRDPAALAVSARTGAGLDALRARLLRLVGWEAGASAETVFLARERHLEALLRARGHLEAAIAHGEATPPPLELLAEELRLAGDALGEITGTVTADDLLGVIFSRFCIGK